MKRITKKSEGLINQAMIDSELRYRRLFETTQDGILILDAKTGMIEDVNPYLLKMLGYSRAEFIKKKLWEIGAFEDIEASKESFKALQKKEYIRYENLPLKAKSGQLVQVEFVSNLYVVGHKKVIQCSIRDNTEHRRIIAALEHNEKTYRDLINQSHDGFFVIASSGEILTVNKTICQALGYSREELLCMNIWDIIPERYLDQHRKRLKKVLSGESLSEDAEYTVQGKDGKAHYVEILSAPHYSGKDIVGFQGIARDITERKNAQQEIDNLAKFSSENPNPVLRLSRDSIVLYTNVPGEAILNLWGCEVGGHSPPFWRDLVAKAFTSMQRNTVDIECENKMYAMTIVPITGADYVNIYGNDVTERNWTEEALIESETNLRSYTQNAPLGFFISDQSGRYVEVNTVACEMLGYTKPELLQLSIPDILAPQSFESGGQYFQEVVQTGSATTELLFRRKDDTHFWSTVLAVKLSEDRFMAYCQDVTNRKQADEKIKKQLAHLTALGSIDRTISTSLDLKFNLSEILSHVTAELGVDAAFILILNSSTQILEFGAERGFRTKDARMIQVRLGESYAGQVALKRQLVQISDLNDETNNSLLTTVLQGEAFVCYFGVPLIVHGQVVGVLEVFHHTPLEPDTEWVDFLNNLAGQAAIAIENARLFENLQSTNSELMEAYETTLEGWSRTLDLRDQETEGHTQRVTKMAVDLARDFGLSEEELVDVRRGGLLHDIGKMGVPDHILLKPGKLTEGEWEKIRMHPVYAYDLLSPISYLHNALDIPHYHHEKWDGSGYPDGLKGDQIPLVARIFAVVDVWDALTSDRPYRKAWTKEKALEYIRSESGTHFDAQVIDMFLQKLEKKETHDSSHSDSG